MESVQVVQYDTHKTSTRKKTEEENGAKEIGEVYFDTDKNISCNKNFI